MKVSLRSLSRREGLRYACSPHPTSSPTPVRRILNSTTKQFTTSSRQREGIAAPPIQFSNTGLAPAGGINFNHTGKPEGQAAEDNGNPFFARFVPVSRSYFTAQPKFMDDLLRLQNLVGKYALLPTIPTSELPRVAWISVSDYRNIAGEHVKTAKYSKFTQMLQRLHSIHPALMPKEVNDVISEYKRDINPFQNKAKVRTVDKYGRGLGAGRRKTATARAWLVEGTGEVLINGKSLAEAFARVHDRESVIWALKATDRIDKYNVWGLCEGGGTTGQAEALALAVGKALLVHEPALKPAVRRAGCVTRDPRRVERKKPGHVKARKMPAWVKR